MDEMQRRRKRVKKREAVENNTSKSAEKLNEKKDSKPLKKKNKRIKKDYKFTKYKIYAFAICIAILAFIAVIVPLRPKVSTLETRSLNSFPKFSLESFMNGEFFEEANLWYSDTFPFREQLLSGNLSYRKLYGFKNDPLQELKHRIGKKAIKYVDPTDILMSNIQERMDAMNIAMEEAIRMDPSIPMVALTFDDGPSEHTERLLDILSENNAKATFYLVGSRIDYYPDAIRKMSKLGMEFGNHTYNHQYLTDLEGESEYLQIQQVDDKIMELVGKETVTIRPPGGWVDDTPSEYIDAPLILWSIDTKDWETRDADSIADIILEYAEDGDIILMHDLYKATVDAMEVVIPELQERGFKLVTVTELAKVKGYDLEVGKTYTDFPLVETE